MTNHEYYERHGRIDSPRLWLRPMHRDDAELIVEWRNEPGTAAMFFSRPPTLEEHLRWFEGPRRGRVDYVVVRKDIDRPIGVVNFKDIDEDRSLAEAGKLLGHQPSRGRGMAKEAFASWLMYGFGILGLQRVLIRTRIDNRANIHLNKRLGFNVEGQFGQRTADGTSRQFVLMTLEHTDIHRHDYFRSVDRQGYFEPRPGGRPRGG